MLGLRKQTKIIHFEKSHNAENCKGGPLRFFNIHSVAKFQKNRMGTLETLKTFRKQKLRIFNSLIVPKNLKEGTL